MPDKKKKSGIRFEKNKTFKMVSPERIAANEWNPNEMSAEQYELLMDNISRIGFGDPITVTPFKDEYDENIKYRIVDGEHRWRAARDYGMEKIPVVIVDGLTEVDAKKQTIRLNKIRGELSHKKFNKLIDQMIRDGDLLVDSAAFEMGFADEEEFALFRDEARKMVPKEGRKEFDKRAKQAETLDDIYTLVMLLVKKYGDTIDANWLILQLESGRSMWVKIDQRNLRRFESKAREVLEAGYTFDSFLVKVLQAINVEKFIEKHGDKLVSVEEDGRDTIEEYIHNDDEDLQELSAEVE